MAIEIINAPGNEKRIAKGKNLNSILEWHEQNKIYTKKKRIIKKNF